jgi:hypothetical protein
MKTARGELKSEFVPNPFIEPLDPTTPARVDTFTVKRDWLGDDDGARLGDDDGARLGDDDGARLGDDDGVRLGDDDGARLGDDDGARLGDDDGARLGDDDGADKVILRIIRLSRSVTNAKIPSGEMETPSG